jgi:hypothetical protein
MELFFVASPSTAVSSNPTEHLGEHGAARLFGNGPRGRLVKVTINSEAMKASSKHPVTQVSDRAVKKLGSAMLGQCVMRTPKKMPSTGHKEGIKHES